MFFEDLYRVAVVINIGVTNNTGSTVIILCCWTELKLVDFSYIVSILLCQIFCFTYFLWFLHVRKIIRKWSNTPVKRVAQLDYLLFCQCFYKLVEWTLQPQLRSSLIQSLSPVSLSTTIFIFKPTIANQQNEGPLHKGGMAKRVKLFEYKELDFIAS